MAARALGMEPQPTVITHRLGLGATRDRDTNTHSQRDSDTGTVNNSPTIRSLLYNKSCTHTSYVLGWLYGYTVYYSSGWQGRTVWAQPVLMLYCDVTVPPRYCPYPYSAYISISCVHYCWLGYSCREQVATRWFLHWEGLGRSTVISLWGSLYIQESGEMCVHGINLETVVSFITNHVDMKPWNQEW